MKTANQPRVDPCRGCPILDIVQWTTSKEYIVQRYLERSRVEFVEFSRIFEKPNLCHVVIFSKSLESLTLPQLPGTWFSHCGEHECSKTEDAVTDAKPMSSVSPLAGGIQNLLDTPVSLFRSVPTIFIEM